MMFAAGEPAIQQGVCFAQTEPGYMGQPCPAGHHQRQLRIHPGEMLEAITLCLYLISCICHQSPGVQRAGVVVLEDQLPKSGPTRTTLDQSFVLVILCEIRCGFNFCTMRCNATCCFVTVQKRYIVCRAP